MPYPRIAILSVHSCPLGRLGSKNTGGMNVYVREIATALGNLDYSVDVFTRGHQPDEPEIIALGKNSRLIHILAGKIDEPDKTAMFSEIPQFLSNLEILRTKNDLKYDIIFSHYWISGATGITLQKLWNIPHITMYHTLGLIKNTLSTGENEPEIRLKTERDLAINSQQIIATTPQEKTLLNREFEIPGERICVIPCGVNTALFRIINKNLSRRKLGLEDAEKVVLFVGRLEELKGIDRLIEACALLKEIKNFKLLIIGGGGEDSKLKKSLKQKTTDLSLKNNVQFIDAVPQNELPYFYNAADVFVLPSYYESFGMVALEALACGTPVVASNVGSLEEIIQAKTSGFVMRDNSPGLIAQGISQVLLQPWQFEPANIRRTVIQYDWQNIALAVSDNFANIVAAYVLGRMPARQF